MFRAILLSVLLAGPASASPYLLKFQNPGTQPYTQIQTAWGTVAAPCAGGATCSVVIDIPYGQRAIKAKASDGSLWSVDSNVLNTLILPTATECMALPACRFDVDQNQSVSVSDFGAFLGALGSSW